MMGGGGGIWKLLRNFPDGHPLIFENVWKKKIYIYICIHYMYMLYIYVQVYRFYVHTKIYIYSIYTYSKILDKPNDLFGNLTVKMRKRLKIIPSPSSFVSDGALSSLDSVLAASSLDSGVAASALDSGDTCQGFRKMVDGFRVFLEVDSKK